MKPIVKAAGTSIGSALASAVLISLNLRWLAFARRTLRKWRAAP